MQTQQRRRVTLRAKPPPPPASGGTASAENAAAVTCRICWTEAGECREGWQILGGLAATGLNNSSLQPELGHPHLDRDSPLLDARPADSDEGGVLLSPCRCTGSQRYVHQRCLAAWMASVAERRGVHAARRCSVCQARYVG